MLVQVRLKSWVNLLGFHILNLIESYITKGRIIYAPLFLVWSCTNFLFLKHQKLINAEYDNCEANTVQAEQMPASMF